MNGIEDKLKGILSDPEAVSKLKSLGQALGLDTSAGFAPEPKPQQNLNLPFMGSNTANDETLSAFMRLAPLLNDMGKDDETACLLNALRPFLSEPRRKRLEQAGKMLKVMRLLPILRESRIF